MESTVIIALPTLTEFATSGANLDIVKIGWGNRLVFIIPLITLSNFCPPGYYSCYFFTSLAILVAASAALNQEVILSAKGVSGFAAFNNSVFVLFNLSLIVFLMECSFSFFISSGSAFSTSLFIFDILSSTSLVVFGMALLASIT